MRGHCWLRSEFLPEPIELVTGDIIGFPHGDAYQLSATPESSCVPDSYLFDEDESPTQSVRQNATTIIFGHIAFQREFNHPFVRTLPRLLHVRAGDHQYRTWLQHVSDMLIAEVQSELPGSSSVAKRLAEVLHLYTLRAYILDQEKDKGYAAVFRDATLYQALQIIHQDYDKPLKLEEIAQCVGMSRTSFATRFRDVVGITPMRYITMWRMQKAQELLETTNLTLAFISEKVGYQSEAAFSRAFQREFNQTPGQWHIEHHL